MLKASVIAVWIFCIHILNAYSPETPFLLVLVDAPHLDYANFPKLLATVAKHRGANTKGGDIGHAWIWLQGKYQGQQVFIEGGHSAEAGDIQPRYLDGIMDLFEKGELQRGKAVTRGCRYEPDPIRYLFEERIDGFFQRGAGGHTPLASGLCAT